MNEENVGYNNSEVITTSGPEDRHVRVVVNIGDLIIVGLVLLTWISAIAMFMHRWNKMQVSNSSDYRFNNNPKNLDSIKVVGDSTDSVIHKTYSKELSTTMVARQKRFEQRKSRFLTSTDPDVIAFKNSHRSLQKTGGSCNKHKVRHKDKFLTRSTTSPVIEVNEPPAKSLT